MKKRKCYIYTRVSTSIQIDGYSLDAQLDKLKRYAELQNMTVLGEYSDAGRSGKNIIGRPAFQQMLDDIVGKKDDVRYVLVFKLSRFGRNAADVLSSLQLMQLLLCPQRKIVIIEDKQLLPRILITQLLSPMRCRS